MDYLNLYFEPRDGGLLGQTTFIFINEISENPDFEFIGLLSLLPNYILWWGLFFLQIKRLRDAERHILWWLPLTVLHWLAPMLVGLVPRKRKSATFGASSAAVKFHFAQGTTTVESEKKRHRLSPTLELLFSPFGSISKQNYWLHATILFILIPVFVVASSYPWKYGVARILVGIFDRSSGAVSSYIEYNNMLWLEIIGLLILLSLCWSLAVLQIKCLRGAGRSGLWWIPLACLSPLTAMLVGFAPRRKCKSREHSAHP
ncbi:hypothetical protein ACIQVE_12070 [Pseudomonas sp. NPDC098747]|uniref:hypothetical protein n=1 Tax=Pseudomonas sp. NPDC098747 TaxID=3364487 RepID=UPI00383A71EC